MLKICFCHPGLDPGSSFKIKLNRRIEAVPLDSGSMLCFAWNDTVLGLIALAPIIINLVNIHSGGATWIGSGNLICGKVFGPILPDFPFFKSCKP